MFEVTAELIQKLKCSQCEGYLSTSPVILKANGDNVCGKCGIPNGTDGVRNEVFEELAAFALFPCQNYEKGCREKFCFEEIKYHELGCEYRRCDCPVSALQNCIWSNSLGKLKHHFEDTHHELIVTHPYKFKPNIRADNEKWLLMEMLNFLFIVQIKCNVAAAKLWFCVRYIGNPKFAALFDFMLDISNDDVCFKQKKVVQSFERLLLSKNNVLEIDINLILKLVHNFGNMFCTISIKLKNEYCSMCCMDNKSDVIRLINSGYYCFDCSNKIECKYHNKGCTYKDIKMNILKHELWLCPFSENVCTINDCNNNLSNHINLIHHIGANHCKNKTIKGNNVTSIDIVLHRKYKGQIKVYNAIFIRDYYCDGKTLYCTVISNLSKQETKKYKSTLIVFNIKTGYRKETEMKLDLQSIDYDWIIRIIDDKFNTFIRKKNVNDSLQMVYSCELKINKIC